MGGNGNVARAPRVFKCIQIAELPEFEAPTRGTMVRRHVAFAAALALASCVDADVPAFCTGPACRGSGAGAPARSAAGGLAPRMVAAGDYLSSLGTGAAEQAQAAPAWTEPAGYVPRASQPATAQAPATAHPHGPTPPAPETSEPRWTAPVGYKPRRAAQSAGPAGATARSMAQACQTASGPVGAPPAEDAEAVMARVSEMMMARGSETGAPAQAKLRPAYGGYDPKSRAQSEPAQLYSAAAVPLTSAVADAPRHVAAPAAKVEPYAVADAPRHPAPAAKFEPYGGYDPKSRVLSTHASTTSEPVQTSRPAETSATFPFPPTPQAASKWAPYAGYDPLKRRTAAPAPEASAPSPPTEPTTTDATSEEPARVLPAKKWQPYGGYVPGRRKTEAAAQPMPWPSASHVVHASTHVPATSASADKASELWRQRMVQGLAAQSQTPQHVQAPAAMPLKDTHAAHAELEKSLVDQRFGPFAAADSEDDELSLAPSVNTLDAASPERAQRELDALGSIKNDFLARLDAAGARAAGEHMCTHAHARRIMRVCAAGVRRQSWRGVMRVHSCGTTPPHATLRPHARRGPVAMRRSVRLKRRL